MIAHAKRQTKRRHSVRLPSAKALMEQRALSERHAHTGETLVMHGRFDDGRYTATGWSWMPGRRLADHMLRPYDFGNELP